LAWTVGGAVLGGLAGKYAGRPIAKGDLEELGSAMTCGGALSHPASFPPLFG
jgi:hypothetical protein